MDSPPNDKKLQAVPFIAHATRGVIRDRGVRRKVIGALLTLALLMLVGGSTVLREILNPREHFGWFAAYWLGCGWLTFTAMLLAVFDLLLVRAESRAEARKLRAQFREKTSPNEEL